MNSPWVRLLLIALVCGAIGFFLGRTTRGCGGCSKGRASCHAEASCGHGGGHGASCHGGGACCKGGGHGGDGCCKGKASCEHGGHGEHHGHAMHGGHGEDKVHVVIQDLKAKNFQGDTTVAIEGGTVQVKRTGEQMEVKVEMSDSVKKTVEVHAH